jgi:hypothetical protein
MTQPNGRAIRDILLAQLFVTAVRFSEQGAEGQNHPSSLTSYPRCSVSRAYFSVLRLARSVRAPQVDEGTGTTAAPSMSGQFDHSG